VTREMHRIEDQLPDALKYWRLQMGYRTTSSMKTLVCLLCLFAALGSMPSSAQTLRSGGVVFAFPDYGAWEFVLLGGGPGGVNKCPPIANGFCYVVGGFHLIQTGPPGACDIFVKGHASCQFDGDYALNGGSVTRLDANCDQLSFPISNGKLQIETRLGLKTFSPVNALYTQTLCNLAGAGTSVFNAGGSLVVYLPGNVP
jgi:hypothetical protein